jgi:protein-S-isoprenylcysteine O-methyltransferase Ste14
MNQKSFLYRFVVLSLVYLFFAATILIALSSSGVLPPWAFWTLFGVLVGGYLLLLIINELIVRKKSNKA